MGMTAIIEFSPLNLMRFLSTMHQGKEIEKSAVHQRYSFLFNTSHVVLGDMPDFFKKKNLDYKTCHTIYSKTRLKYKTQQPSVDVTMTSSLL